MRRALTTILTISLAIVAGLTVFGGAANAEIAGEQKTWWGVQGEGFARTVGDWDALAWATEPVGGTVYVGGKFLEATNGATTYSQPYMAAFDAGDGKFIPWFRPDVGGPVLAIKASPDGGLFVGGEMDEWNGVTTGALQKIDPTTGDTWPGWNTRVYGGTSVVRDIRLESDGWLYVVGSFTTATEGNGPIPVSGAIRIDPLTGDIDPNWKPIAAGGAVWGVGLSQTTNEVYLAGWFTSMNGDSDARGFAGVSSTNGSLLHDRDTIGYNTCVGCDQYYRLYDVVATEHGNVWVGGEQHALFVLEEDQNLAMSLMHYTNCNRAITADCAGRSGGEFQEIERIGDRIYATCHCWQDHMTDTSLIYHSSYPTGTNTGKISALAAYDPASGQRIQSFNPYLSGDTGGMSITGASDGCLWLAGGLSQVGVPGNQIQARDIARLCDAAGPGPDPEPNPTPPPVATCSASNNGTSATITWPADDGDSVIIERSVDGGNWSWRGKVDNPGTSFSETVPDDAVTTYRALTKWGSVKSLPTTCSPAIDLTNTNTPAAPPASCSATNTGTAATINWTASANANDYRVYRSIDGGNAFWRGVTASTSYNDTLRSSGSHLYSVQARGADGAWSASTTCSPALNPNAGGGPAAAPASCSATNTGTAATINWAASANADDYRVFRTVNGGNAFWRGLSTTTSYNDTLRSSGTHVYSVQARGADGVWSASKNCSPSLDPNAGGGPAAPPASCSATKAGQTATINWTASPNATDYRVYRSVNGGNAFWRGLSTTTSFTDSLRASGTHAYTVQARGADGIWSASTTCSPALVTP